MNDQKKLTDSGSIGVSQQRWTVTHVHDHETLVVGDVVVVAETPSRENVLIRESDMSVHAIHDRHAQYVHLEG